ncbi:MAG: AmmeMemoRadiSam system protein B [Gemmatimonadetes bacterium]|jgi:MEMO1 family protein|nr:AmmeMemoRadiSam system protein B [Gemmatimonadota bacterium]MBT6146962.1 AmmeMemoRadiSam system protein B [Gemmatimonadota bacterium]MBT7863847.1 AmmeMemoRadiSam system protein B [Gemmatimonadota bacterium]
MPDAEVIRPAAVAGRFYAENRQQLSSAVTSYLSDGAAGTRTGLQGQPLPVGRVKALICPHAGYIFSGPVAGSAYAALGADATAIRRVVVIGPAHRVEVRGLVAASAGVFATPLGGVRVDPVVGALCTEGLIHIDDAAHREEHALEVQLPFLQSILEDFTIVPLLFGQCEPSEIAGLMERLWGGEETLFVISSDLTHFHPHSVATQLDHLTSTAIESLDADGIDEGAACGRLAVQGLLQVAARRGLVATAIDVRTSAETAGDPDRVVGYGAYVFHVDG